MAAWNSFSYTCRRALHSFWSFAQCRPASTVIALLPKVTFTSSIQPNLGLHRTRPPLTSAINTLLGRRYQLFPHAKTISNSLIGSTRLLPLYSRSHTHLIIHNSIHSWHSNQTYQTLHLKDIPFPSLSTSYTPCICSIQRRWCNYSVICRLHGLHPQSSIAQHTLQRAPCSIPLINSVHHIPFTSSIICHLRPQVLKTIHVL